MTKDKGEDFMNKKNKVYKNEKAITLVSLVVTIILLLILAGISIKNLSNTEIFNKTKEAKEKSEISTEEEIIHINIISTNSNRYSEKEIKKLGTTLYDKNLENGEKWDIVVNSNTLEKYGTGWNYIPKGTEIEDYGKTKYYWVANYDTGEIKQIDENFAELSYKSSLAVTDKLALNIDATNAEDNEWDGIIKYGDVTYSKENKSLYFDGDGDYLELSKKADFSNGFTFEIYANLDRIKYDNGSGKIGNGLFCKLTSLENELTQSMRFGFTSFNAICKFCYRSSWQGKKQKLETVDVGDVRAEDAGYTQNKDFYLTFVYRRYNKENPEWDEVADKIEYYINGNLYGYTYYGIDSYNEGCESWNTDTAHFYLGVCPWHNPGNLYYLKGNVYCSRLYERALSSEEVQKNVKQTELYRQVIQ